LSISFSVQIIYRVVSYRISYRIVSFRIVGTDKVRNVSSLMAS